MTLVAQVVGNNGSAVEQIFDYRVDIADQNFICHCRRSVAGKKTDQLPAPGGNRFKTLRINSFRNSRIHQDRCR